MAPRRKHGRDVHGIVVLDKPSGRSSNHVLQHVRRLFQANKAGHTGSLDPLATGVLPICLGHATKVSSFLLDSDKSYQFEMQLGVTTTTGDSEGEVLQTRTVPELSVSEIDAILDQFKGAIEQIPPMHSALKHNGQPLYKLARAGIEVERPPRRVHIHALTLMDQTDSSLLLQVDCSKGTYVRSLAQDIGEAIGCGAHVTLLHRIKAGPFELGQALTLEQMAALQAEGLGVLDACLLPVDAALADIPQVYLSSEQGVRLMQGQPIELSEVPNRPIIRVYQENAGLIGLGKCLDDGRLAPRRML